MPQRHTIGAVEPLFTFTPSLPWLKLNCFPVAPSYVVVAFRAQLSKPRHREKANLNWTLGKFRCQETSGQVPTKILRLSGRSRGR
jgi:hypothetical protein